MNRVYAKNIKYAELGIMLEHFKYNIFLTANHFNCSDKTIYKAMKIHNLKTPVQIKAEHRNRRLYALTSYYVESLYKNYRSVRRTAKHLGLSYAALRKFMLQNGIEYVNDNHSERQVTNSQIVEMYFYVELTYKQIARAAKVSIQRVRQIVMKHCKDNGIKYKANKVRG